MLHVAWFKPPHPDPTPVQRPAKPALPAEQEKAPDEPPRMSTREEVRAFFRGDPSTSVAVTKS